MTDQTIFLPQSSAKGSAGEWDTIFIRTNIESIVETLVLIGKRDMESCSATTRHSLRAIVRRSTKEVSNILPK
jgi:hypothetical protein